MYNIFAIFYYSVTYWGNLAQKNGHFKELKYSFKNVKRELSVVRDKMETNIFLPHAHSC